MAADFQLVQRLETILDECRGKRVLHLGCTNHPYTKESIEKRMLLHDDLSEVASDLWGLDSDEESIAILEANGAKQIIRADLERLSGVAYDGKFDVIVAGEMIEHLNNPGAFVSGIKRFMTRETRLIITTVNAYCGMRFFWYGLRGKGGIAEFVHPDHVAYYSYSTLTQLLKRHDLHVESFLFYDLGIEHRPHSRWPIKLINDVCVRFAPQWADGVIAICTLPPD